MAKISRPISPLADVNVTLLKGRSNVDCSKPDVDLLIGEDNPNKVIKNLFMDIAVNLLRLLMMMK
jgi:hypothetical protein